MLNVPAFVSDKNRLEGKGYRMLLEIEYTSGQFFRLARHDHDIVFDGNTYLSFPIGSPEVSQTTQGEIPAYEVSLSNIGREMLSIFELYAEFDEAPGRLIWVHPDHLSDPTAKVEEPFTVVSARANRRSASITCSPVTFDPLGVQLPRELVTTDKFPGIRGNGTRWV